MRMTQIIGLNQYAIHLIEPKEEAIVEIIKTYLDGTIEKSETREFVIRGVEKKEYSTFCGMSVSENYPLFQYTFADGRVLSEYVQASPWSGGPCIFLALKDQSGNLIQGTLWSEDQINNV